MAQVLRKVLGSNNNGVYMNSVHEFFISDAAKSKLHELTSEEANLNLNLKMLFDAESGWGFAFDEMRFDNEVSFDFGSGSFLINRLNLEALNGATIDFEKANNSFNIINARDGIPVGSCSHINELPPIPCISQLNSLRKGLRKQKIPIVASLTEGGHKEIGAFSIEHLDSDSRVTWNAIGKSTKTFNFSELCFDIEREFDRLEFGWMIANMARLDMLHGIQDARKIPHPIYEQREVSRVMGYFEKMENRWRHWSLVTAGHMLIS